MNYRSRLIRLVTFLGGIYFFLEFMLPGTVAGIKIDQYHEKISNGFTAVGAAAIGLGLINLLMVHGGRIALLRKGWLESSALLVGLASMTIITAMDWSASLSISERANSILVLREFSQRIESDFNAKTPDLPPLEIRLESLQSAVVASLALVKVDISAPNLAPDGHPDRKLIELGQGDLSGSMTRVGDAIDKLSSTDSSTTAEVFADLKLLEAGLSELANQMRELASMQYKHTLRKNLYELMYQGLFVALGAAMFSLLGFYIAVAAYRAFRIRSAESALMMTAALLVMLGQIPFGIWIWDALPDVRMWLLSVPNSAAFRAIKIGAAVAGLIMAFRMWFSIESETFVENKK